MSNAFEDAMHHGMSREDIVSEMREIEARMKRLGCENCCHFAECSNVCNTIIEKETQFPTCPYCSPTKED